MSRDFLASRVRSNALIGNNSGSQPSLLMYPVSQATNNNGGKSASLQNFLDDANNYSGTAFLYVHGTPTTSSDQSGISPSLNYSIFGGDVLIKGTLFSDYLRTTSGTLISFDTLGYIAPVGTNYISDPSGPTSSPDADKILDAQIKLNETAISTNLTSINSITTILNTHENSIGLDADGLFIQKTTSNYLNASSSISNETFLLDAQIKVNEDAIALKADNASLIQLQTEVDAIETASGLNNDGTYTPDDSSNYIDNAVSLFDADIKLDTQIKLNSDAIADLGTGNLNNLQTEVDVIETSVGLNADGSYFVHNGSNYLDTAISVKDALSKLDVKIKENLDNIALKASSNELSTLQAEVDVIETSVGLNADGTYSAHVGSNYLDNATSSKDALSKLDTQLNLTQTDLETAESNISTLQNEMNAVEILSSSNASQTEVDAIETATGLNADGSYSAHAGSNYLDTSISVKDALSKLDTQLKLTQDELENEENARQTTDNSLQSEVNSIESSLGLTETGLRPNYSTTNFVENTQTHHAAIGELDKELKVATDDISSIQNNIANLTTSESFNNLQTEVDAIETAVGLNADGTYSSHIGSNYLDNSISSKDALSKLDAQLNSTQTDLDTAEVNIASLTTAVANRVTTASFNNLQTEVDAIETAVGLNADGSYSAHADSNYLNNAISSKDALSKLDEQLNATQTDLDTAEANITTLQNKMTSAENDILTKSSQTEVDAIETSVGLNADGSYFAHVGTNYLDASISVKDALNKLDTQLKLTQDEVDNEENLRSNQINLINSEINSIENSLGLTLTGLRPNYTNTNFIQNTDTHHIAIGKLDAAITTIEGGNVGQIQNLQNVKDSIGTDNDGNLVAFDNTTNFLENISVVKTALIALDTAIASKVSDIFDLTGIDDTDKENGKILQYVNDGVNPEKFVYVEATTGPQGPAGQDGRGISSVTENNDGTFTLNFTDNLNPFTTINLTGPQGPQGIQGEAGPQGIQGPQGVQGLQGDSAYQVWLDEGNVGDEAAFISSLQGPQGDIGPQGEQGPQGPQGDVGPQGEAGPQGIQGEQGPQGIQGEAGPQGIQGEAGPQGDIGPQGEAGADAPTISGVSISGSTITTSFNGANDAVVDNAFSVSIADLDNVNIDLNTIANGKILKWDDNTNNFIAADDQSGDGGGGGVDLTVTDNTTSVLQSATLDVQQLATVTDSGNNVATLVGIIGNAEDTDYTDGLFTDFTNTTTIGTAIDRFNEVLKALAPTPAPDLDQFDVDTANSLLQNIKLSFGTSNDQSAAVTPYASVGNISGFDATDTNEIFAIESVNGNYRKGVYTGSTSILGTLNEDVSSDTYTNNIVNYANNSFGNGDQGTLQLWLNGNKLDCDVDLSSDGAGDYLDADGSGFINLTAAISGKFSSDTEFPTFKHRQGEWKVDSASQRNGWNYAQVKHVVGESVKETGYAEWVNDSNNEAISVTNKSLSLNMAGSKYLSGIQYHTSGTATYTADIDNFYKYVYATDNITFTESPDAIANFDSVAISSIDTTNGENHAKQINLSQVSNLLPINNRLLNQSLTAGFSLSHPIKANVTTASTNETVTGILLDNVAANSTVILDNFNDEQYRQTVENAYTQTNLTDAGVGDPSNAYSWDSTESLIGADSGHNTGLIVYNSRLYSPKNNDLPNSGNFSTLSSSYANPDYSVVNDNDVKVWIRKFKNNSGNTIRALLFSMSKNNSDIVNSNTPNSDEINVQFKVPSKDGNPSESEWLTVASDFNLSNYEEGTLVSCGDQVYNGNINGNTINNKIAILKDDILNNEYVLVKITASADWAGYVDSISVNFVDVIGNVVDAPEIEHIDLEQTGVTGRLSFGTTNSINNFTNYTSDINTLFDLSGDKSGIFDSTQTVTGFINDLTNSNGNNYVQYAFGGGESHKGTLKLHVNGQDIHTINLATRPYLTGNQLNNNGSGFTNLTSPTPARDANNRPDFDSVYRTSKFVITPTDQRLGYNFAKVIHITDDGDEESNTIEWINDNNSDTPDFTDNGAATYSIDSAQISSTETNSLSGIAYYKKVTNVPYEISVKNMYKNIYSSASDAVEVTDTDNNSKIKSILLTGTNNNAITNSGSHDLPGNSRSGSKSLPAITAASDESEILKVQSIFEVNYVKSILDLDAVDNYANMNDITINTTVKHPLNAANGKTTSGVNETATSNKFLQYTVSTDNQSLVEEDFSNETRRILSSWANANDNQAAASGSSWDSTTELTDGLLMYDDKLRYPDGDFRDANVNIHAPAGNPNYTGSTGTKSFYRIFQNTTQNAKTGFSLQLQGNGSVIVDPDTAFSATNIKISVKIPETGDAQSTGYLNIAKAFETGQYNDDDGSLSGNLSSSITNGQTTTNTITFGQKFLQPNEYFVLKIEANENWTGYLSNITVDWS